MAGKNPRTAVNNFLRPIRKSLQCVTDTAITLSLDAGPGKARGLLLNGGEPTVLKRRAMDSVQIRIEQNFRTVPVAGSRGPWKVEILAYAYYIEELMGREIVAFHWHPQGPSPIRYPHVHLGPAAAVGRQELVGAHIPGGRIALEQFLLLLIESFGVRIAPGVNWKDVLGVSQTRFERWRTWG